MSSNWGGSRLCLTRAALRMMPHGGESEVSYRIEGVRFSRTALKPRFFDSPSLGFLVAQDPNHYEAN
jgi:hypothetical protein